MQNVAVTLPRLYIISDRHQSLDFFGVLEQVLEGGARLIQLREKDLSDTDFFHLARKLRKLSSLYNATLLIHSRLDIALKVGADGVHLSKDSVSVQWVRERTRHLGKPFVCVYSAHSLAEALLVERAGADAVTFSPVFCTPSKADCPPQGVQALQELAVQVKIPVFALGGVNALNLQSVLDAHAYGAAFVSEIFTASSPYAKVQALCSIFNKKNTCPRLDSNQHRISSTSPSS